jgi:hypothetical protein
MPALYASPQLVRQYTSQPPEFKTWGAKLQDESPQDLALAGGASAGEDLAAPKVAVGSRVECFFKSSEEASDGEWYSGEVTAQNGNGSWQILFDDGEEHNFDNNDPDLRLESFGPWTTWLESYMPGLLLSAYRAARRTPTQLEMRFFNMVQNPEQFRDSDIAEFQPKNFCDVEGLCGRAHLCDDADSASETPAKRGKPRAGPR